MSYIEVINYERDWSNKSVFQSIMIDLLSPVFVYEQKDSVDDILETLYDLSQGFPYKTDYNISLMRQLIFIEGIDFLYRAINFLQAIQKSMKDGFFTASQSMSYQASFFATRSILAISGVYCSCVNNKDVLIESFYLEDDLINQIYIDKIKRNHQNIWSLFTKLIKTTTVDENIIDKKLFKIIQDVNYNHCSNQRHSIHYYNKYEFKDLFERVIITPPFIDNLTLCKLKANNCEYFLMASLLVLLASNLFYSISQYTNGLEDLYNKLNNMLSIANNPILKEINFYACLKKNN